MASYPKVIEYLVVRLEPLMDDNEVALVLPEAGAPALLEQDGQAARGYARESLAPATRRLSRSRRGQVSGANRIGRSSNMQS